HGGAVAKHNVSSNIKKMVEEQTRNNRLSKPLKIAQSRGIYSFDVDARTLCPLDGVDGEEAAGVQQEPEESEDVRIPKAKMERYTPTAEEIAIHEKTRAPHEDWCECRLRGRGKDGVRRKTNRGEDAAASIMLIDKGPSEHVHSTAGFYLDVQGAVDIISKGDQEPSLQAAITAAKNRGKNSTQAEMSPKRSHQSNGAIENAVERVESLLRTSHSKLEFHLTAKIGPKSWITPRLT
ncbi:unnamed protein product, partial [Prorocentrum cordatum]